MSNNTIETVRRQFGFGSPSSNAFTLFNGINHMGNSDLTPTNLDNHGYVFFTKPVLNLVTENIRRVRKLHYLTTLDPNSSAAAIKAMLMPYLEGERYEKGNTRSSVIDDKQAFIPLLSNTLLSLSGWPDEVVESLESKEGWLKQVHSHVDDQPNNYGVFDLSATFVAKEGDPHLVLFTAWREYMTRVANGSMVPFPEMIAMDEIDYMTRIYVIILGPDRRVVQKLACCGAAYPKAVPTAASFNYTTEKVFAEDNFNIDIPFKCHGAIYNDPIIIDAFNRTVINFNPDMDDTVREDKMQKLSPREKIVINNYGYPRINPENMELEWWLDFESYNEKLSFLEDDGDV